MEDETNSTEFEFWMLRNPSSQQTTLHSADQLFSGGILLPLHLLSTDDPPVESANTPSMNTHGSDLKTTTTASKRWKDIIFKKNPQSKDKEKKKKKDRNSNGAGVGTAELNINIWPFSRSRSAGSRPRTLVGNRKVSSAPCSRSNSSRSGVHLGRSSPVWQAKRFGQSRNAGANGNINVIGYRQRMSCQTDVADGNAADVTQLVTAAGEAGPTGLFNFKTLFTKKVF